MRGPDGQKNMKRIVTAILLIMIFAAGTVAAAASPAPQASARRIGLTIYLVDDDGNPVPNAVVLLQKNLDAQDAYEGKTDGRGAVAIPNYPMSGFILAVRDDDDTVTGLVSVSLYPSLKTEIMNKPQSADDTITEREVQNTAFSRNVSGARSVDFQNDEMTVNHYEVGVNENSAGLAVLFQQEDSELYLRGVGEGSAGEIAPEPTLPPDDEDRPEPTTTVLRPSASASPSDVTEPEETPRPTETETQAPTEEPSPEPTERPTPSPTPEPTVTPRPQEPSSSVEPSQQPTVQPTPSATAQPTAATPQPTSAPTTLQDYINIKLLLKDQAGNPLAYYVAVLNSVAQATCNEDGEAYFTNVPASQTNQLVVRNTLGDQVGACGLQFVEGNQTMVGSLSTGGTYTISYAKGTQDVYVEIVVDVAGTPTSEVILEEASAAPIESAVPTATPTPSPAPSAASSASAATATPNEVIGTPAGASNPGAPSVSGYFSNEAGIAVPGATIRVVNQDTRNLSSSITNSDGAFGIGQLPPANYSLNAIDPSGRNLGTINFTVARGKKTQVKTGSDGKTYLTEGPDDSTIYMDLRELSNGTVDLMYASKSPLTAPAVLTSFTPLPTGGTNAQAETSAAQEDANLSVNEDIVDVTEIERPGQETEADAGTVVFVVVLCAMGVAIAAILLVRHAKIR